MLHAQIIFPPLLYDELPCLARSAREVCAMDWPRQGEMLSWLGKHRNNHLLLHCNPLSLYE